MNKIKVNQFKEKIEADIRLYVKKQKKLSTGKSSPFIY